MNDFLPSSNFLALFPISWMCVMALCAAGSRHLVRKRTSPERQTEVARYSNKLTSATATGLFVLIGFGITMSWSTYTEGQSAVASQFAAADELIIAAISLDSEEDKNALLNAVADYLDQTIEDDFEFFANEEIFPAPSVESLNVLQMTATEAINNAGDGQPIAVSLINDSIGDIANNRGQLLSVSKQFLPTVVMVLIVVSSLFVALFMGASLSDEERPWLLFGWVFVLTLALAAMVWIAQPFSAPLEIDIASLGELADAARSYVT